MTQGYIVEVKIEGRKEPLRFFETLRRAIFAALNHEHESGGICAALNEAAGSIQVRYAYGDYRKVSRRRPIPRRKR